MIPPEGSGYSQIRSKTYEDDVATIAMLSFGAIACAILAAGWVNIISLIGVFMISIVSGLIAGFIIKATRGVMDELFADATDFDLWHPEPLGIEDEVVTENK